MRVMVHDVDERDGEGGADGGTGMEMGMLR